MSDLHARETELPDWDGPIVELVEEDRVVGIAYLDEGALMAEFHLDEDGEAWVFEVADLQRVLDTAAAMLGLEDTAIPTLVEGHPVDRLADEFDKAARVRGEEDEGFYPVGVAAAIAARCDDLGLAVVSLEGFSGDDDDLLAVPGHRTDLANANQGEPWLTFQAGCNLQARVLLDRWAARPNLLVAIEVADETGERFVL